MSLSRRAFLKSTAAVAVAAGSLKLFGINEVFGADTVLIPHASHYGPFKAVVRKGVLIIPNTDTALLLAMLFGVEYGFTEGLTVMDIRRRPRACGVQAAGGR